MTLKERILMDISEERDRQKRIWGTNENTALAAFVAYIKSYAEEARRCDAQHEMVQARREVVKVAALAVALIEGLDRAEMKAAEAGDKAREAMFDASQARAAKAFDVVSDCNAMGYSEKLHGNYPDGATA